MKVAARRRISPTRDGYLRTRKVRSEKLRTWSLFSASRQLISLVTLSMLIYVATHIHVAKPGVGSAGSIRRLERDHSMQKPRQIKNKVAYEVEESMEDDEDESGDEEVPEELLPNVEAAVEAPNPIEGKLSNDDDTNYEVNSLWHGRIMRSDEPIGLDLHSANLHGVLSLCLADLGWLREFVSGYQFHSFTIVSKCGVIPNPDHLPDGAKVMQMENVGRIDHTIAHYMVQTTMPTEMNHERTSDDIVVFLKDNVIVHTDANIRNFTTMLKHAKIDGFGCALEPKYGKSFFHITDMLATFYMDDYTGILAGKNSPNNDAHDVSFKSEYHNMGAWLRDLGISLPKPLTPVCYGGNFAVERSRIEQVPHHVWLNLERSLSRGDNIEEGHFAERVWAGLLYRPLTDRERELLFQRTRNLSPKNIGMRGALMKFDLLF